MFGQGLAADIAEAIRDVQATVGVAASCGRDTCTVGNGAAYPLMSVFKFHVAVTALRKMETERMPLDHRVHIEAKQLRTGTYSPLRERYPNRSVDLTMREVLEYTVSHSDNNTCDWLIDYVGGIGRVDSCIRSLGIEDFSLTETEHTMHQDVRRCYHNWCTPGTMVTLLRRVYEDSVLTQPYFDCLEQAMLGTSTGRDKMRAGIPADIPLGHKTGSSDRLPDGTKIGDADAGVIYLPDGRKCYLAIFLRNSQETDETNAQLMANIARRVYEWAWSGNTPQR